MPIRPLSPLFRANANLVLRRGGNLTLMRLTSAAPAAGAKNMIFQDSFESGTLNSWDGTHTTSTGTATVQGTDVKSGDFSLRIDCPEYGDVAFPYKHFSWPASNILHVELDYKFVGASTYVVMGGGFFLDLAVSSDADNVSVRWDVEANNQTGAPEANINCIKLEGMVDAGGMRLYGSALNVSADTWYHIHLIVDYTGTNPKASMYIDGTKVGSDLVDTSVLSVNATPPTYLRLGQVWWDEQAYDVSYRAVIDNVEIYS